MTNGKHQAAIGATTTITLTRDELPRGYNLLQFGLSGPTSGTLAVRLDDGAGLVTRAIVDFSETERGTLLIVGSYDSGELVPSGLDAAWNLDLRHKPVEQ